jgi:processive 1,2-diacylglycerol beta-glucosyltransferase
LTRARRANSEWEERDTGAMRVLIATATAGGGHLAAAAAMEEAWRSLRPEDVVEKVDLVKFFSPLHRKLHADGYLKLVEHAPEIWGIVFKKTDNLKQVRRLNRLKRLFSGKSRAKFINCLSVFEPDAVLCTHYLPLETLGALRRRNMRRLRAEAIRGSRKRERRTASAGGAPTEPMVVSIVTDFEAHALWMEECVDLYCVAAEETKARLIARGARAENMIATGIPIAAKFSQKIERRAVRKKLGLRDDQPVLLVLSGGFGMGPVGAIVDQLDRVELEFQVLVVTGRNEQMRRELAAAVRQHPTHVLGFADNMHELMAVSDLVVSKPGGLTSSESLAMGKPLFILNPIPGQEAANSDFLLERGAAAKANRVEDLPFRVGRLLASERLAEMAKAARALGKPAAAKAICQTTVERIQSQ